MTTLPPVARGVITYATPNDAVYAVAPTGTLANSGWQWEGLWHDSFTATAIGPEYVLAAAHTSGYVGATYTLNNTNYTVVPFLDGQEYKTVPGTDLTVWRVQGATPMTSYAPLFTTSGEAGNPFVVYGRGTERGDPVTVAGIQKGWLWGADSDVLRWGQNTINGYTSGDHRFLYYTFDAAGGPNEATVSVHDSGGGVFIFSGGQWKLAGVNYSVGANYSYTPTGDIITAAIYDGSGLFDRNSTTVSPAIGSQYAFASRVSLSSATIQSYANNWTSTTGGTLSLATNWLTAVPGTGDLAAFSYAITSPQTVTATAPQTFASLGFDNANRYTIAASSASNVITVNGTLTVASGSHTISAPLNFGTNMVANVIPAGSTLSVTGPVTASSSYLTLSKQGAGALEVTSLPSNLQVTIHAGTIKVLPNGTSSGTSHLSSIAFDAGTSTPYAGQLNLSDNDVAIDYTGVSPIDTIRQYLLAGRASGAWTGTGINSSSAAGSGVTAIGYAEATSLLPSVAATINGSTPDSTTVLLKYTYYGDTNLDGKVNSDDYVALDRGRSKSLTGWVNGDFNYDGAVDSQDYLLIDKAFAQQSGILSPALLAERQAEFGDAYVAQLLGAVPEPALPLVMLGGVPLLIRRRRSTSGR